MVPVSRKSLQRSRQTVPSEVPGRNAGVEAPATHPALAPSAVEDVTRAESPAPPAYRPGAPDLHLTAYDIERPSVATSDSNLADPLIGQRIDHFEVRGRLGYGGMGIVYLAHDTSLERPVALKILRRDYITHQELIERMMVEARAQARIQHPNVATIYYVGQYEGAPYIAMEYVHGKTLETIISEGGALPWQSALEWIIQTTKALMAAHARGIVHRDIKPSNLILDGTPLPGTPLPVIKVADFGLAIAVGAGESHFGGSPHYASPEQIEGKRTDHRSDMYSLGVTFYELLMGSLPFDGSSLQELFIKHKSAPRPVIPADRAPWRLRQLVTEMMDPEPTKRPWTYEELIERLRALRPINAKPAGLWKRGLALAIDLTITAIVAQGIAGFLVLSRRLISPLAFVLFSVYIVVAHRMWGTTWGKRLFNLRLQGTARALSVPVILLRYVVEFWGPLAAFLMVVFSVGSATNLEDVRERLGAAVGVKEIPVMDGAVETLLRILMVPSLALAVPWLSGFLVALFDEQQRALHDRIASTKVIEVQPQEAKRAGALSTPS